MSAGTLTLTNNSAAVAGSGTAFTTEVTAGDFIVVTVGGVPYTLPVKSVESGTTLTLVSNYTGPTQSGAAWSAVPRVALNMVTAAMVVQNTEALRGLNYDKQNWQQIFSKDGDITIRLPDNSTYEGKSWKALENSLANKQQKDETLTDLSGKDAAGILSYLGLGDGTGRLIGVRVITTSGTYTPTTRTKSIVVEVQGAGGAGGAAGIVTGSNIAMGGGGAAGAYARARLTFGFAGIPITIGAKGTGKNPDYSGKSGGATSFGTITAAGGGGGLAIGATPPFILTTVGGSVASGGSIVSITGSSSFTGIALNAVHMSSGPGGSSPLGSGGGARTSSLAGDNASGYGSGGGGALNVPGAISDLNGGDGSDGVVIVWEYA